MNALVSKTFHPRRRADRLILLAVTLGMLGVETLVEFGLRAGGSALGWAAALHLGALIGLVFWIRARRRQHVDIRMHVLLALMGATLGVIGVLGVLWCLLFVFLMAKNSKTFESWYRELVRDPRTAPLQRLLDDIASGREETACTTQIVNYHAVLAHGSHEERQGVMSHVARHFQPSFMPLIEEALRHRDASLRVQAATAIEKLQAAFTRSWLKLQASAQRHSQDFETHLRLAAHLDAYADSRLLEPAREAQLRERAVKAFRHCLALQPGNAEARRGLIQALVKTGLTAEAIVQLSEIPQHERTAEEWTCYASCLFDLGRYADLRELANVMSDHSAEMSQELRSALALWTTAAAPPIKPRQQLAPRACVPEQAQSVEKRSGRATALQP
jgi:hypothetical protein